MGYLVCHVCKSKELINPQTFGACLLCGNARYAEDEDGEPLVVWTKLDDETTWNVEE